METLLRDQRYKKKRINESRSFTFFNVTKATEVFDLSLFDICSATD